MSNAEDKKDVDAAASEPNGAAVDDTAPLDLAEGSVDEAQRRRRRRGGMRVPSDNVPRPQAATPVAMPLRDSAPVVMSRPAVAIAGPDEDVAVDVDMEEEEAVPRPARTNGSSGPHRAGTDVEELADADLVEDTPPETPIPEAARDRARTEPGAVVAAAAEAAEELSDDEIQEASAEDVEKAAAPMAEVHDVETRPVHAETKPAGEPPHAAPPHAAPPPPPAPVPHAPPPVPTPAGGVPILPMAGVESKPVAAPPPRPAERAAVPPAVAPSLSGPSAVRPGGTDPAMKPTPPPAPVDRATRPPGSSGPHTPVPHAPPPPPPATPARRSSSVAAAAAAAAVADPKPKKRKGRAWYEEIFDDDYLRTLPFLTPQATQREAAFITEALTVKPGQQVLDVGCGYGRHAMELAARGYHVVALDLSLPLLLRGADEAQRRGLTINFVHGDMRELAFESQFDGAFCVFSTFGYFDDETNRRVAMNVARALKPGGRLVIDVLNRDYIIADLPTRVWWEGDGCVVLEEVDFNYYTSRLVSNRSVVFEDGRQLEQEISIRAYGLHELGKLLHQAGFRVLEVSGNLAARGRFFGNHSRQMIVVAEKRADRGDPSRDTLNTTVGASGPTPSSQS